MIFRPSVGLNGLKITSSFDIEEVSCEDLKNDVYQLAVVLYPPEVLNEKFLIRLRDCVLKLSEEHPLKRWMKWVARSTPVKAPDLKTQNFLVEIINSRFNLITDQKIKNEIINLLHVLPEDTLPEEFLKSYLYLMIGNITRSDNILRDIMRTTPKGTWEKSARQPSLYHKIASDHAEQIIRKLAKHPADRRTFELFGSYLTRFYNDETVQKLAAEIESSEIESKLDLKYVEGIAPSFVHYLRFSRMGETRRFKLLRDVKLYPHVEQAYWVWPFVNIDPLVSDSMIEELKSIEKQDELWFIYLMDNEKMADLFSKKQGRSFLPGRRPFLKSNLSDEKAFMLSLYKLIELGDINQDLILSVTNFITHE